MMFQSYALFPHMSVERNIAFGLKQDRLPKARSRRACRRCCALVQLETLAQALSAPALGRASASASRSRAPSPSGPKVLLLDEPLAALDKKLREETQFELMDIQHELGMTFVVVTHDQEEAMTMADRIAVMNHGRIVQVATPGEIYEQPQDPLHRRVRRRREHPRGPCRVGRRGRAVADRDAARAGGRSTVDDPDEVAARPGQAVAVAIRPEKMTIRARRPPGAANALVGRGLGHRLSRRLDDLSREARQRRHPARLPRQCAAASSRRRSTGTSASTSASRPTPP